VTHPALRTALWTVQVLLFLTFVGTALWKVLTPLPQLATMIIWAGEVPAPFFYLTALLDLLGGLGILLPALTRIQPGLTVLAALGIVTLQVGAIVFHVSRGEAADTPFNILLVALAGFVAWGSRQTAAIAPRSR
jgi:hypothetical protein